LGTVVAVQVNAYRQAQTDKGFAAGKKTASDFHAWETVREQIDRPKTLYFIGAASSRLKG